MTLFTFGTWVTDELLDEEATRLSQQLNQFLDVVEGKGGEEEVTSPPLHHALCQSVDLDFLTWEGRIISDKTRDNGQFDTQFAICECCGMKQACLELAVETNSVYGIWGGTLPKDRR